MGQVSVNWVEMEDTGSVRNAQGETCEWEEENRFLWGCCKADAGAICLSFLSVKQHLPGLLAAEQYIFDTHTPERFV